MLYIYIRITNQNRKEMKTTKTTTTAYEIENRGTTIIGHSNNHFFVKVNEKWGSYITEYTRDEMMEIYGFSTLTLKNIADQLN